MRFLAACVLPTLVAVASCSGDGGGPNGGTGGADRDRLTRQSDFALECSIDSLVLRISIELSYQLDQAFTQSSPSDLSFAAAITFDEATSTALVDAMVPKVDLISVEIEAQVVGATPSTLQTALRRAPINDFDLEVDTNGNGVPGPHTIELDAVSVATTPSPDAQHVELGPTLDSVSLVLGDFELPSDCLSPALVGYLARFPINSAP